MNYEKKYNKLVEAVKQLQKASPSDEGIQNWVNDNVPELRKSEGERIRKEIIDTIHLYYGEPLEDEAKEMIAWLEKQKEPELSEDFGEYVAELSKQFPEVSFAKLSRIAVRVKNWLEKQGQKPQGKTVLEATNEEKVDNQNCVKSPDKVNPKFKVGDVMRTLQEAADGYTDGMPVVVSIDNEYYHCTNELIAIKDQDDYEFPPTNVRRKVVDKVQPKFNVGDWVVNKFGVSWHIDSFDKKNYQVSNEKGHYNYLPIIRQDEMHLWTIQDAKDGDVLACESGWTCIFKTLVNDENFSSYCFMDDTKWFCETGSECHTLKEEFVKAYNGKFYPATKEQRDMLFQKMKEAGYMWDAEKKELKLLITNGDDFESETCEQKPAEWSEDYTERMGQIINYLTCQAKEEPTRRGTLLGWVALLKSIFRKGLPEIQIPCTEAARKGIHRIMDVLDWAADKGRISDSDCEDYMILLSAYIPQPKQEWSEEDERNLQGIIDEIEANKNQAPDYDLATYDRFLSWLKSLKNRYTWKPSKGQMEVLLSEVTAWEKGCPKQIVLESLYNDLKKLK